MTVKRYLGHTADELQVWSVLTARIVQLFGDAGRRPWYGLGPKESSDLGTLYDQDRVRRIMRCDIHYWTAVLCRSRATG